MEAVAKADTIVFDRQNPGAHVVFGIEHGQVEGPGAVELDDQANILISVITISILLRRSGLASLPIGFPKGSDLIQALHFSHPTCFPSTVFIIVDGILQYGHTDPFNIAFWAKDSSFIPFLLSQH